MQATATLHWRLKRALMLRLSCVTLTFHHGLPSLLLFVVSTCLVVRKNFILGVKQYSTEMRFHGKSLGDRETEK
jgi:hypothetical protein